MLIDDEGENRGEGEEGRTPEEQDRGAQGDAGKDPTQDRRE